MRLRMLWSAVLLTALALCPALLAGGEFFPRSTFVYVEFKGGPDLTRFCDIPKIVEMMESHRDSVTEPEDEKGEGERKSDEPKPETPGKKLQRIAQAVLPMIDTLELAVLDITQDRDLPVKTAVVLTLAEAMSIDWFKALDPWVGERLGVFDTDTYQGKTLYTTKGQPDSWALALVDRRLIYSNKLSAVRGIIDALAGKADPQEQLSANPRFVRWSAGAGGKRMMRCFVDAVGVNKLLETFLPAVGMDAVMLQSAMKWTGWGDTEYVDIALDASTLDINVNFREAPVWACAIPAAGDMSMLKYLPAQTVFCAAVHTGELDRAVDGVTQFLDKALTMYLNAMKEAKNKRGMERDMFNMDLQPARSNVDDFLRETAYVAYQRAAVTLADSGKKEAFSGAVEDLAKMVGEPSLNTSILGYKPDRITGLKMNEDRSGYEGLIAYKNAAGQEALLSLKGRDATCEAPEGPGDPKREDGLTGIPIVETANGAIDALMVSAGVSRKEASAILGTNGVFGIAANPLEVRVGGYDGATNWFVAFELRKADVLMNKLAAVLTVAPEAEHVIDRIGGKYVFSPSYEKGNVKAIALSEELCIAFTDDAALIGAPGIVVQMLDNKRRPDALIGALSGMTGCAICAWDMAKMNPATMGDNVPFFQYGESLLPNVGMGNAGAASVNYGGKALTMSLRHGMKGIASNPFVDMWMASEPDDSDQWLLPECYEQAQGMYAKRLADDKKDNDRFPTIAEVLAAGNGRDEDVLGIGDGVSSYFPGRKLEDVWMFMPPVCADGENPLSIIALSLETIDGRFLATTSEYETLSLSMECYEKLVTAMADPKTIDASAFDIANAAKLNTMEAALWLEAHWLSYMGFVLEQRFESKPPKAEETFFLEGIGNIRVNSADEKAVEVMVSGFGHSATYLVGVGIISASWRDDLSREKPRKEPRYGDVPEEPEEDDGDVPMPEE